MAERLALPTSDHGVAGSNPAEGEILPEFKRRFIAQSLSCSPFHRLEMTEILLKGRKTLTHPSIHPKDHRLRIDCRAVKLVYKLYLMPLETQVSCFVYSLFEPHRDKTSEMACAPSEDSDQPGHPPSLIKVFAVRSVGS